MAKCQFCGTVNDSVKREEDGLELCQECSEIRESKEEEMKKEEKVVEADFQEVEEEKVEVREESVEKNDTKCELVIGTKEDGSLYFNVAGSDPNLLTIEGLLEFGKRRLADIWKQRDIDALNEQQK
jgi:hypothetical protein